MNQSDLPPASTDRPPAAALGLNDQRLGLAITSLVFGLVGLYLGLGVWMALKFDSPLVLAGLVSPMAVVSTALVFFLARHYRKAGRADVIDYLNVGVHRYALGLFMVLYGLPKIGGHFFDYQLFALDAPMGQASDFELAWYVNGKNPWQELFVGIMEFVPALLLLHRRTYYFAALLLLPVAGQVLVSNLFLRISPGPTLVAAIVLFLCNGYILYSEKTRILAFIRSLDFSGPGPLSTASRRGVFVGRSVVLALVVLLVGNFAHGQVKLANGPGHYQQLVGVYTLVTAKTNGASVDLGKKENAHRYYKDLYIERQSRWNQLRRFDGKLDAFVLNIQGEQKRFSLLINKGGTGDRPNIIDKTSELKGIYGLDGDVLTLEGTQFGDSLVLTYKRRGPKPKKWLW